MEQLIIENNFKYEVERRKPKTNYIENNEL